MLDVRYVLALVFASWLSTGEVSPADSALLSNSFTLPTVAEVDGEDTADDDALIEGSAVSTVTHFRCGRGCFVLAAVDCVREQYRRVPKFWTH